MPPLHHCPPYPHTPLVTPHQHVFPSVDSHRTPGVPSPCRAASGHKSSRNDAAPLRLKPPPVPFLRPGPVISFGEVVLRRRRPVSRVAPRLGRTDGRTDGRADGRTGGSPGARHRPGLHLGRFSADHGAAAAAAAMPLPAGPHKGPRAGERTASRAPRIQIVHNETPRII